MGLYLLILCTLQWIPLVFGNSPEMYLVQKESSSPVICHVTGVFPHGVSVFWEKDGEVLRDGVQLGEPVGIGTNQTQATLKVSLADRVKHNYTCVVQHAKLRTTVELSENKITLTHGDVIYFSIFLICTVVANCIIVGILGALRNSEAQEHTRRGQRISLRVVYATVL
ncbi:hypothetical protein AAFF_G00292280 [Aldrovandia affinis]|uniref:Ig-like domain-containing protein n=1 Tax=Aldrovandia affinis TaxID=143900 RepID=A0AAD7SQG0_9TELE|nr:hypothetical protein AAFF_G00292280 [Aldrovandia affinis]